MPKYELQKAVGAYSDWFTKVVFNAENDDEAHRFAAEYVSSRRFDFGERNVRIIRVAYEGGMYGLGYSIEEDEKYIDFRAKQLASETEMHLRMQCEEDERK